MSNKSRLEKSTTIIANSNATQWCYVNTNNEFKFMEETFIIDESVEEYRVHNKAGTVEDFTNEAYMEEILVVVDRDNKLKFYNQNYDYIDERFIRVKE